MTCQLFPGILAFLVNASLWTSAGEPDDPYQWLEEIGGARPMAWVKERNRESTGELTHR